MLIVLVVLAVLCSQAQAQQPRASAESIRPQATEILTDILEAIREGDYEKYISRFASEMRSSSSREEFLTLQKNLQKTVGQFKSMDYLGQYEQEHSLITLFKARFSKEKDDVLIRLVLDGAKSKPKVTGLWFDCPSLRR